MKSSRSSAPLHVAPLSNPALAGGPELPRVERWRSLGRRACGTALGSALLATGCLALLAAPGNAQTSNGLRNSFRIVTTTGTASELLVDSGWQTSAPLVTPGNSSSSTTSGCASQAHATSTSDYGFLRCVGAGTANNCNTNGVFLNLDTGAGAPWAQFFDTLTVTSSTLPHGTPVQLSYSLTLSGHCTAQPAPYLVNYVASLSNGRGGFIAQHDSPGTVATTVTAYVGAQYSIRGELSGSIDIDSLLNLAPPVVNASYSLDLRVDASIQSLTPGVVLQFASGGDYAPTPVAYCTAGTSTNGCSASISATANPSAALASPCLIAVSNVDGLRTGLLFYGVDNSGFTPLPWTTNSTSLLCVKPPTQRMLSQSSGGTAGACDGSFAFDWNAFQAANPLALGNPWSAGAKAYAQAWFRDPPAPKSTSLSNALELTLAP